MSYSKMIIQGNLTRDPELRTTPSGKTVCSFTVAVNTYMGVNAPERADFYNVSVWEKRGENCYKMLHKGDGVLVDGRPSVHGYVAKDGKAVGVIDIEAREVGFTYSRKTAGTEASAPTTNDTNEPIPCDDDDVPLF